MLWSGKHFSLEWSRWCRGVAIWPPWRPRHKPAVYMFWCKTHGKWRRFFQ